MDESPRLIIIRGNSGSGKSTLATKLRLHTGRKCALVGQDMLRRVVLKEKETEGGDDIDLIEQTVRFALGRGYDVVLEGILARSRYGPMLGRLATSHSFTYAYYIDVSFEETLCRHANKPNAHEFGEKEMRGWWLENDVLGFPGEKHLSVELSFEESIGLIVSEIGKFQRSSPPN